MRRVKKTLRSFKAAGRGIIICLCTEPHFRFHMAAAMLVLLIAPFYRLSIVEYAVLMLTFAMVMSAEVVNTALERVVDLEEPCYSQKVAVVKDLAAGAVLVCAVFAGAIGACFFLQPEGLKNLLHFFTDAPWRIAPAAALLTILLLFISPGPLALYRQLKRCFARKE